MYDKFKMNEQMLFHAGVRYDLGIISIEEEYDWFESVHIAGTDTNYSKLERAKAIDKTFNNVAFAIGLNYDLEHLSLKANIGKSYRMPIAKELSSNGVNYHHFSYEKGNSSLSAEIAYQLDISAEWHYSKWAFQISPFVNYFPNYIYLLESSLSIQL